MLKLRRRSMLRGVSLAAGLSMATCPLAAANEGFYSPPLAGQGEDEPEQPVSLEAIYIGDAWTLASGGVERGSRYIANLSVATEADLEPLIGWDGATILVSGLYNNGRSFSELSGDAQIVSNSEAGIEGARLYEAWIEQDFADTASVKVGLYDLNAEFDVLDSSALFIGSPHGIGTDIAQSSEAGPSIFPVTSLSARVQARLTPGLTVRAAVLDGVPGNPDRPRRTVIDLNADDGALLIGEAELTSGGSKILFGHWRYTAQFEAWSGTRDDGNAGWYLRGEAPLLSEPGDEDQGLYGFFRVGIADGRFNPFDAFVSGGMVYTGPFDGRDKDQLGVAFATAFMGEEYRIAVPSQKHETALELTYKAPVAPWLSVQPGVHYTINPSAAADIPNALAFVLRTELAFATGR